MASAISNKTRIWTAPDWHSRYTCDESHCLEIVKLDYASTIPVKGVAVLVPGFFQNGADFDLIPEQGISFARYLMKEKGLQIYFVHVRGIGNSDVVPHSNLDDIAMDDLPAAFKYVSELEHQKVIVIGHSQGGITSKAAISGLDHCGSLDCFNTATAANRQKYIRGILSIGANQSMSTRFHKEILPFMGSMGWFLRSLTSRFADYVPARELLTAFPAEKKIAFLKFWSFLYTPAAVSRDARTAIMENTLDGSSIGIINQYADGIHNGGLRNSSGEAYVDALKNIHVSIAEVAFENDFFSPPEETYDDTVLKLDPRFRAFFSFPNQAHEDFMMLPHLAPEFSDAIDWLTRK